MAYRQSAETEGTEMNLDQIEPELFVGSCPRDAGDLQRLRSKYGVTAVLNVQADEDLDYCGVDWPTLARAYEEAEIVVQRHPVRDFDPEALRRELPNCVRALETLIDDGHTVYVHCTAGVNRSPSTAIAFLHRCRGWDLEEAVAHVRRRHPCEPYVDAIVNADWEN